MTDSPVFCGRDGTLDDRRLYAPFRDGFLCAECWRALGQPFPRAQASPDLVHETELRTRERMQARGGTDRHLVRNGRT